VKEGKKISWPFNPSMPFKVKTFNYLYTAATVRYLFMKPFKGSADFKPLLPGH
jgi:hypothetical protein